MPRTLLALVTLGFALAVTGASASAAMPSVSVSPASVQRGGTLVVTGRHWAHDTRVELLIGPPRSEASHVAWVTTTGSGTLRRSVRIARRASTGRFVLLACRRSCRVKAQASFRVTAGGASAAVTRTCGHVDVPGGRAWRIRATRTSCATGRSVAGTCLRGRRPPGWSARYSPDFDRTILRSGPRTVSFQLVGGGGCIPA